MTVSLFFMMFMTIAGVLAFYFGRRFITPARFGLAGYTVAWGFLIGSLMMTPFQIFLRRSGVEHGWLDWAAWAGYVGMGLAALMLTASLPRDLVWTAVRGIKKLFFSFRLFLSPGQATAVPDDPERRRFLLNAMNLSILSGSGLLSAYGVFDTRRCPRVKVVDVVIDHLPPSFSGFNILQLTDLHIGSTISKNWVESIVEQTNALKPDLIVLTGDLVDGSVDHLKNKVAPLADLKAGQGKFFVTGNHEYYSGVYDWLIEMDRLGFHNLINEHVWIKQQTEKIALGGVTDYRARRFSLNHHSDPQIAFKGVSKADTSILLAHQPKHIFSAAEAGADLMISGHTHGGQFFPWNYAVCLDQPFVSGLDRYKDTQIYVSCGTGYWGPPIRLGIPPEITHIRLFAPPHGMQIRTGPKPGTAA